MRRLSVSSLEVDRVIDVGVADTGDNLSFLRVGRVVEAVKHPNADKLQLCQVDVGEGSPRQIVCGAWNFGVGATVAVGLPGVLLPGFPGPLDERPLRGEVSRGMILAEDEVGLGTDHAGIMVLPDGIEPGTPLVDVLPVRDQVLDMTPTLNRVDLLSMVGIAREVATLFDGELLPVDVVDPPVVHPELVEVTVDDPDGCPRYIARAFTNVHIGPSPIWLRARLHAAGMRSISNVVDVTNYVMHVYGSPLHVFDRDTLDGGRIVVRRRACGRGATDARRHPCARSTSATCVITDGAKAVALAAIMGGADSEVTDATTEVLLEAANFEPIGILKTSERLGLAYRGLEPLGEGRRPASRRAGGGPRQPAPRRPRRRRADRQRRRALGSARTPGRHGSARAHRSHRRARGRRRTSSARSSSGSASRSTSDWDVTVPTWRARDVTREIDVIEEVARVVLDRVPHTMPLRRSVAGHLTKEQRLRRAGRGRARRRRLHARRTPGASSRPIPTRPRSACRIR